MRVHCYNCIVSSLCNSARRNFPTEINDCSIFCIFPSLHFQHWLLFPPRLSLIIGKSKKKIAKMSNFHALTPSFLPIIKVKEDNFLLKIPQMYFFSRSSPCQVCDNNGKQPSDLYSFFRSEGKEGWRMAQWIIPEITEMTLQIQLALRTHCWNTLTQDEYLGWLLIKLQLVST